MNQHLDFTGKTVVITGAGRGLGRAYALLLAARGAAVVVNDLGTTMAGDRESGSPADDVVAQIRAEGGRAVANHADVTSVEGAQSIVSAALDTFGRIDGLVNNAGIIADVRFTEMSQEQLDRQLSVHLHGSVAVTQAAWDALTQSRGSVVMTASAGMLGAPFATPYNVAKASVFGLMRSLACEGAPVGIRVNAVMPGAETRMQSIAVATLAGSDIGTPPVDGVSSAVDDPGRAAPLVAYLLHHHCPVTGEMFFTGRGHAARVFLACGPGFTDAEMSLESVAANWNAVMETDPYFVPADLREHRERIFGLFAGARRV
jgi:NAD(P)-dependent dehydrogenase (short-subunit alcohol dehydrogenase family)